MGAAADAPAGFIEMCERDRSLCGDDAATQESMASPAPEEASWSTGAVAPGRSAEPRAAGTENIGDTIKGAAQRHVLRVVNDQVNAAVLPRTDMQVFGVEERWARPGTGPHAMGDCEDVALEKRMRLIAAGYPPADLFFAVVYRRDFGLHTVLIARTDEGDVVLDSLTGQMTSWRDADYSWLRVQTPGHPYRWVRVGQHS